MSERQNSTRSRAFDKGDRNEVQARFLFFSGWVLTLLYLPSGLMHFLLGSAVYIRDGLLFLHMAACLYWLARNRELTPFARRHWMLLVPACIILPAFIDGGSRVEALTFVKWGVLWIDWIILGRLAGFVPSFTMTAKVLIAVTVVLLLADFGTGLYERTTGAFAINGDADERTAFGVEVTRELHMGDQLRVKGLQRDVFSFANLMGMSTVLGMVFFINTKRPLLRLPALFWTVAFAAMMVISGGRSALFGVLASGLMTACVLTAPNWTRRYYPRFVLGWLLVCLTISSVGIGRLSEAVGGSVFRDSSMGNSMSAYMRDNNWAGIMDAISRVPVVLLFGAPLSWLIDPRVEVFFHWADNQYFWLLYHTSVLGFVAVAWFFFSMVRVRADGERAWARDAVILFLLFVMGEGLARESMTFIGVMPLFVAIGYYQTALNPAVQAGVSARRASDSRQPRTGNSASSDFTRRIRAKMKQRQ